MGMYLQICMALMCLAAFTAQIEGRPGRGPPGEDRGPKKACSIKDCFDAHRDAAQEADPEGNADQATRLQNCKDAGVTLGTCLTAAIQADATGVCDCPPRAWGEYVKYNEDPAAFLDDKCNKPPRPPGPPGSGPPRGGPRPAQGERPERPAPPTCSVAEVETCMDTLRSVMGEPEGGPGRGGPGRGGPGRGGPGGRGPRQTEESTATVQDVVDCITSVQTQGLSLEGCDKRQQKLLSKDIQEITLVLTMKNAGCDPKRYFHECKEENEVDKATFCAADKTDFTADSNTMFECGLTKAASDAGCSDLMTQNKDLMITMGAEHMSRKCTEYRTVSALREAASCPAGPPEGRTRRELEDLEAALDNFNNNKRRSLLEGLLDELVGSQ